MNIQEFIWIYKRKGKSLAISETEVLELRKQYKEERAKSAEKNKVLNAIFGEKMAKEVDERVRQREEKVTNYQVVVVYKEENYQVEIYNKDCLEAVNAGYGNDYFTKQDAESLVGYLKMHCSIEGVRYEEAYEPLCIFGPLKNKKWLVATSKIRFESLHFSEEDKQRFRDFIFQDLSNEKRKELDFFEVQLDINKMVEKQAISLLVMEKMQKRVMVTKKDPSKSRGLIHIEIKEPEHAEKGEVIHYEYC